MVESSAYPPSKPAASRSAAVVHLPPGVSVADWGLERNRWQNPRLRTLLGLYRIVEGIFDSNYAILHCSPERLAEIGERMAEVTRIVRDELGGLLEHPSVIPELEGALERARGALDLLERYDLTPLDRLHQERELGSPLRKQLCITIGKVHAFLQNTLAELLAADPRSRHDADYLLSRRFPRDIEESEWLYSSVFRLERVLADLGDHWFAILSELADRFRNGEALPAGQLWRDASAFFDLLGREVAPRLEQLRGLRAIRFQEMDLLETYSREIPARTSLLQVLYEAAREIEDRSAAADGRGAEVVRGETRRVLGRRLARLATEIANQHRDLTSFVQIWLRSVENRRALMLAKMPPEEDEEPSGGD